MTNQSETISVDEKFLKGFIGKGGKATDIGSGQQITNQAEADQFLQQHVGSKNAKELSGVASEDDASTRRRAEKLAYTPEEREQRRKEREAQQQRAARRQGIHATENAMHSVSSGIRPLIDKVGSAPVPGGIGLMIAIIMLLLFTVVQANDEGDTRLKMFWYMLIGRAMLIGGKKPDLVTPPAAIGATLTPTLPDGTCPAGFHVVLVSGGKHMCQKDEPGYIPQPGQPGGGPEPMTLYPINNTYRTITGGFGF